MANNVTTRPDMPVRTIWQLAAPHGRRARCLISDRRTHWQLVVWHDETIVGWETAPGEGDVRRRADELKAVLEAHGWADTGTADGARREYFRRACPECRQQTGIVTFRRHGYVVLFCDTCEHGWTDRERVPLPPGRTPPALPHRDRRRAA
jgi:hypothetical protein